MAASAVGRSNPLRAVDVAFIPDLKRLSMTFVSMAIQPGKGFSWTYTCRYADRSVKRSLDPVRP